MTADKKERVHDGKRFTPIFLRELKAGMRFRFLPEGLDLLCEDIQIIKDRPFVQYSHDVSQKADFNLFEQKKVVYVQVHE